MCEVDAAGDDVVQREVADAPTVRQLEPPQFQTASSDRRQSAVSQPPASGQYHRLHGQADSRRVATQDPRQAPAVAHNPPRVD